MAQNLDEVPCAHRKLTGEPVNPKRMVVCCDGTWNNSNDITEPPTNVSRLAGAVAHKSCSGMAQIVYYHPGAGTEAYWPARQWGAIFGLGVTQDIVEVYRLICDNYSRGDEIVLIGFSRGAFTARSVAEMVCKIGFLNRAGVDQLPFIFRDYQNLRKWKYQAYNQKVHLAGFTLANFERVQRLEASRKGTSLGVTRDQIAKDLDNAKKELFDSIKKMTDDTEHDKAAEAYQNMLAEHEMCLLDTNAEQKVPVKGKVRAVGVWDTVGSLGFPRTSWHWDKGRREKEVSFASLDVHPNIEYAFHAIALDEWRTAFCPTMWGRQDNATTLLRQVWFPGSHCNVGGGWEDQQIATIALAWMADQLTCIGVEFNKYEMSRIFYSVNPSASVRAWGMGKIYNPPLKTAAADRAYQYLTMPINKLRGVSTDVPIRKPGLYEAEGERANERLLNPNELIHACVRIRHRYGGNGLDDKGNWACRALTENGYTLLSRDASHCPARIAPATNALKQYRTLNSVLIPYLQDSSEQGRESTTIEDKETASVTRNLVRVERPEGGELQSLPKPARHWVWVRDMGNGKKHVLPEEQVGIWERMFIKINDKVLLWQIQHMTNKEGGADKISPKYGYHDIFTWPATGHDISPVLSKL